jgi:hypothetical protein
MDIKEVKEEIKKEEELLVKVFQLEKFIKKYKKPIIAITTVIVLGLIGLNVYNFYIEKKLISANNALEEVLANPNNKEALERLKADKKLYDLYLLQKGDYKDITTKELEEIKAYKLAMKKGSIKALEDYLNNPNYKILKNSVRVALIRLYLQNNNRPKALALEKEIPQNSQFKPLATYLIHYGIVK